MKRFLTILLALAMLLSLCACGEKPAEPAPAEAEPAETESFGTQLPPVEISEDPEPDTLQDETMAEHQQILSSLQDLEGRVVKLEYLFFGVGGEELYDFTESTDKIIDRLSAVKLKELTLIDTCDCDEFYIFTLDDGTEMSIWFNGYNFRVKTDEGYVTYAVDNYKGVGNPENWGTFIYPE